MKSRILSISILILTLFLSFCGPKINKNERINEDGFLVVTNDDLPTLPKLSLKFEEDLSIKQDGWYLADIAIDKAGNIYAFGESEKYIFKFDTQGKEIQKKTFSKGQGPRDFYFMDPYFSNGGNLYLFDKSARRITILNDNLNVQNFIKIEGFRANMQLDLNDNIFFWVGVDSVPPVSGINWILSKYSSTGQFKIRLFEYTELDDNKDKEKGILYLELYKPCGFYRIDSRNNIYTAMSDKYEITILSPEGILKKMITKTSISRKISQADIDKVAFKSTVYNKTKYVIDENMPYIADFFILDNNYILVITFENDYEDATIAGDIFDNNGNYRGRIDVPKYYWWYSLWNGWKNKAQYKNGYFYTIETDDAEENFCIKRYKMILE